MALSRPRPLPDPLTEGYWTAAANRILAIQHCTTCGYYSHPPVHLCPSCNGSSFEWKGVTGRGVVYQRTIIHEPRVQGFEDLDTLAVIVVELEEQAGLLVIGNLLGAEAADARIGLAVEVDFEQIGDGCVIPQFRRQVG